jgi:hypothetical protein
MFAFFADEAVDDVEVGLRHVAGLLEDGRGPLVRAQRRSA